MRNLGSKNTDFFDRTFEDFMRKFYYFFSILLAVLTISACGEPSDVRSEMQLMNRYTNDLARATNTEDFLKAAKSLREISVEAMKIKPSSVTEAELKGYQQGMQHFIDVVAQIEQLAQAGKLEEARMLSRKLQELKKDYHAKYKK